MTLYLKYRPSSFETLVGQEFIKETLSQAVNKNKLVGAYLFCGPRGTGKTSTARIFAKAINCLNNQNGNPCFECEICKSFDKNTLTDIIEIDAASHTGVDNIRDIIERAKFTPTKCKYKVYIIDEVHMLSKGAFNALLKILEEPPTHLKFILATTEIHKIPETILSRCQRYDFKSISNEDIIKRLEFIAKKEGIKIDKEGLFFIVKQANGGLRNAISLFEQLVIDGQILYENIISSYGLPKNELISNFYNKLLDKDMSLVDDFEEISKNFNLNLFFKELLFFSRDTILDLVKQNKSTLDSIKLLEEIDNALIKSKNSFDLKTTFLVSIIKILTDYKEVITTVKKEENKIFKKAPIKKPVLEEVKELKKEDNIDLDDINSIFGQETQKTNESIPTINQEKEKDNTKNFNKDLFIKTLKDLGAKGALTMSIRPAEISFGDKNLTIYTKTKIAFKQLSQTDNLGFLNSAIEKMGFIGVSVEIK